jgi:hypothetical protein
MRLALNAAAARARNDADTMTAVLGFVTHIEIDP